MASGVSNLQCEYYTSGVLGIANSSPYNPCMSYQVLARKYRPAVFKELEGQEHVLQALINALDNERLHHAYLFTGTRGVGKTTIARILARCLNCETGITSEPCGVCSTCVEISEGRSIDLIEVDAASRTGVDDMRELLDNVQYMPSVSRFKIYLIDEVHMLSRSSFNAMLKTLEEPPEHVKFLFATTDPKKLPITVLSRCLQFNLKNLSPEQIVKYLAAVLDLEAIAYDESALWQLGLAADGSMRDALSLTDQAISFGSSEVREELVGEMLGSIDAKVVFQLLADITSANGQRLLETVAQLSDFSPDYAALLDDILAALHRIAIAQAVDGAVDNSQGDEQQVLQAAERIPSEQVQLFYQIGLIGQRDLPLAPTPRTGFEMALLRMMSFTPMSLVPGQAESSAQPKPSPGGVASNKSQSAGTSPDATKAAPIKDLMSAIRGDIQGSEESDQPAVAEIAGKALAPALETTNWMEILVALNLVGVTRTLAANCLLHSIEADRCLLQLAEHHASLWNASHEERIAAGLSELYGRPLKVVIEVGETKVETPAQQDARERQEQQAKAVAEIENDKHVQQLVESFNGRIDADSVSPLRTGDL